MKILIIDHTNTVLTEKLKSIGFECFYEPDINEKEIERKIAGFEGIILHSKTIISKNLIDQAKNLKFIGKLGAGFDNIDTGYAQDRGILCFNAPEGVADAVGEHALGMLLNLFNNLCRANMQVKNGIWKWEANKGIEIGGKTIGIIGYGNTGHAFAKRLSSFNAKILAYDKYKNGFADQYAKESRMDELFAECDILSLHIPLTKETLHLVDYPFLKKFQKEIYIINTSSGQIINTDDLARALQKGFVLGAAFDVLEFEKSSYEKLHFGHMPESLEYLIDSDNVIFSPHIAGSTVEAEYRVAMILADRIIETFDNK